MKCTYSPILRFLWHVFHVIMWPCFLEFTYITVPESQHTLQLSSSGWTWHVGLEIKLGLKIMAWKGNQWIAVLPMGRTLMVEKKSLEEKRQSQALLSLYLPSLWKIEGVGIHYFEDLPGNTWGNQSECLYREYQEVNNI